MKIIKKRPKSQLTVLDLSIGDVFEFTDSPASNKGPFMRIWSDRNGRVKWTGLNGDAGQTYSNPATAITRRLYDFTVKVYPKATVCLDGES